MRKKSYIKSIIYITLVCCAVIAVIYRIGNIFESKYEEKIKKPIQWVDDNEVYEQADKQRMEDYKNGESAMGGDDSDVLDENVDAEDELMCQDLYDQKGKLLWKGITLEEAKHPTKEQKENFDKAYMLFSEASEEVTEDTELSIIKCDDVQNRLTELCIEYDETIPYAENGYDYYMGFDKETDGYDNTPFLQEGQSGYGMCGLGYITWCYRNVLGKTPKELKGKKLDKSKLKKIRQQDLLVGDICIADTERGTIYGIVCGKYKEKNIVTLCDVTSSEKFPTGRNHMVYIKNECNELLGNSLPIAFDSYYRVPSFR